MFRGTVISAAVVAGVLGMGSAAQAQTVNWTGLYVGAEGGGAWGRSSALHLGDNGMGKFVVDTNPGGPELDPSGAIGGLNASYLFQNGGLVLGLRGSYDWSDIKGSTQFGQNAAGPVYGDINVKSFGLINGELGVANGPWLAYATGGVAIGSFDASIYGTCGKGNCLFSNDGSATHTGWDAGAGISYAISNSVVVGVEYEHVDLGSSDVTLNQTLTNGLTSNFYEVHRYDPAFDTVKATLSYHFGADRAPAPLK